MVGDEHPRCPAIVPNATNTSKTRASRGFFVFRDSRSGLLPWAILFAAVVWKVFAVLSGSSAGRRWWVPERQGIGIDAGNSTVATAAETSAIETSQSNAASAPDRAVQTIVTQ